MKKIILLAVAAVASLSACTNRNMKSMTHTSAEGVSQPATIHTFKVQSIDGGTINFADFKGKKILVVNTASKCGFTPQYADLQKLYDQYKDQLVVVGFPADNFGHQEPGTNEEIGAFCKKNYGVTFPMAAKVSVKGDDTAPVFRFLTEKAENDVKDTQIAWNFTKFLLDENGHLIDSFGSATKPTDAAVTKYLQ